MAKIPISFTFPRVPATSTRSPTLKGRKTSSMTPAAKLERVPCMARPTAGRIHLDGREITSLPERFLSKIRRDRFGFIFQNYHLIQALTALENAMVPAVTTGSADVALAYRTDDFVDLFANYRSSLMPLDTQVLPIAVKDTNGDMEYSPIHDWWGMYEPGGEFSGVFCREDTGEKDSLFNSGVEIFLRPPVGQPTVD